MFTIDMLPAYQGDCLWVEYGTPDNPHRVLIDGGPSRSYKALKVRLISERECTPNKQLHFELLVVTHVDSDHIAGVLELLVGLPRGVTFGEVWFNGWDHLPNLEDDRLGPVEGEQLSAVIKRRKLRWNQAFEGKAACVPEHGTPPCIPLDGGMQLTVLSPTTSQLVKLRPAWKKTVEKAGLAARSAEDALKQLKTKEPWSDMLGEEGEPDPEALASKPFAADSAEANGSSIALLAEFEGRACLLASDA
ncbi:MAG: hypothetical protein CYG59_04260, partial [Chloroflexi bacterium]